MNFVDIHSSDKNQATQNDYNHDHACELQSALLMLNTKHGNRLTENTVIAWARELQELGITDTRSIDRYNKFVLEKPREKLSLKGLVNFIKKDKKSSNPGTYVSEKTGKTYPLTEQGYMQEKNDIDSEPMSDDEVFQFNKYFGGKSIMKGRNDD
tara:strand:+ start:647 stop:1108 length:462 start_codon:yes stop_codon:yes gene_type:complete